MLHVGRFLVVVLLLLFTICRRTVLRRMLLASVTRWGRLLVIRTVSVSRSRGRLFARRLLLSSRSRSVISVAVALSLGQLRRHNYIHYTR